MAIILITRSSTTLSFILAVLITVIAAAATSASNSTTNNTIDEDDKRPRSHGHRRHIFTNVFGNNDGDDDDDATTLQERFFYPEFVAADDDNNDDTDDDYQVDEIPQFYYRQIYNSATAAPSITLRIVNVTRTDGAASELSSADNEATLINANPSNDENNPPLDLFNDYDFIIDYDNQSKQIINFQSSNYDDVDDLNQSVEIQNNKYSGTIDHSSSTSSSSNAIIKNLSNDKSSSDIENASIYDDIVLTPKNLRLKSLPNNNHTETKSSSNQIDSDDFFLLLNRKRLDFEASQFKSLPLFDVGTRFHPNQHQIDEKELIKSLNQQELFRHNNHNHNNHQFKSLPLFDIAKIFQHHQQQQTLNGKEVPDEVKSPVKSPILIDASVTKINHDNPSGELLFDDLKFKSLPLFDFNTKAFQSSQQTIDDLLNKNNYSVDINVKSPTIQFHHHRNDQETIDSDDRDLSSQNNAASPPAAILNQIDFVALHDRIGDKSALQVKSPIIIDASDTKIKHDTQSGVLLFDDLKFKSLPLYDLNRKVFKSSQQTIDDLLNKNNYSVDINVKSPTIQFHHHRNDQERINANDRGLSSKNNVASSTGDKSALQVKSPIIVDTSDTKIKHDTQSGELLFNDLKFKSLPLYDLNRKVFKSSQQAIDDLFNKNNYSVDINVKSPTIQPIIINASETKIRHDSRSGELLFDDLKFKSLPLYDLNRKAFKSSQQTIDDLLNKNKNSVDMNVKSSTIQFHHQRNDQETIDADDRDFTFAPTAVLNQIDLVALRPFNRIENKSLEKIEHDDNQRGGLQFRDLKFKSLPLYDLNTKAFKSSQQIIDDLLNKNNNNSMDIHVKSLILPMRDFMSFHHRNNQATIDANNRDLSSQNRIDVVTLRPRGRIDKSGLPSLSRDQTFAFRRPIMTVVQSLSDGGRRGTPPVSFVERFSDGVGADEIFDSGFGRKVVNHIGDIPLDKHQIFDSLKLLQHDQEKQLLVNSYGEILP